MVILIKYEQIRPVIVILAVFLIGLAMGFFVTWLEKHQQEKRLMNEEKRRHYAE